MDRGIWAIWYELDDGSKSEYLAWFHEVHIPEKLARPGYVWAAHYELRDKSYLALFGGATAHTFLNPSPGQLAQRQSPETKRMIGMRRQPSACILAEEIRIDGPEAARRGPDAVPGPLIHMENYNAASPVVEDDLGAWRAQEQLPLLAGLPGCMGARTLLATVGAFKHAMLCEFVSAEACDRHFAAHDAKARDPGSWAGRVSARLGHAPRSPARGQRIWPPLGHR